MSYATIPPEATDWPIISSDNNDLIAIAFSLLEIGESVDINVHSYSLEHQPRTTIIANSAPATSSFLLYNHFACPPYHPLRRAMSSSNVRPRWYPVSYFINGQNFTSDDVVRLQSSEHLTDTFIEHGIRAMCPDFPEDVALTVSSVWDWNPSQTRVSIESRLGSLPAGGMALIIRGNGIHFTLEVRFYGGQLSRADNYLVDSLDHRNSASDKDLVPIDTGRQQGGNDCALHVIRAALIALERYK